jgi:hypothetical protein
MSKWREKYKVHPVADLFPIMSNEELEALGKDIEANGLHEPIAFAPADPPNEILDGRNRLEAMERAGIQDDEFPRHVVYSDPVAYIISKNLRRRHLTKQKQADLTVAAAKIEAERKLGQACTGLHKGGRGKKNPIKEEAFAINAGLPIDQRVGERWLKRRLKAAARAEYEAHEAAHPEVKQRRLEREARVKRSVEKQQAETDKGLLQKHDRQVKTFLVATIA